ncbi:MAG: hypothetical protein HY363_00625 [Candidatus Aenigmarchaeota archaeon]|nr:hypothetical protein [Candidatus Aenigmarchaeota archaeon]
MSQDLSEELSFFYESILSVNQLLQRFVDVEEYAIKEQIFYKYNIKHPHTDRREQFEEYYASYIFLVLRVLSSSTLHVVAKLHAVVPLLKQDDPARVLPAKYKTNLVKVVHALDKTKKSIELYELKENAKKELPRLAEYINRLQAKYPVLN